MDAIAAAKLKLGIDAMGGSGAKYWQQIAEHYRLDITVHKHTWILLLAL